MKNILLLNIILILSVSNGDAQILACDSINIKEIDNLNLPLQSADSILLEAGQNLSELVLQNINGLYNIYVNDSLIEFDTELSLNHSIGFSYLKMFDLDIKDGTYFELKLENGDNSIVIDLKKEKTIKIDFFKICEINVEYYNKYLVFY